MLPAFDSRRCATALIAAFLAVSVSTASAQDFSADEVDPVDATVYIPAQAAALNSGTVPNQPKTGALKKPRGTFRSDALGGEFAAEWMRMTIGGNQNGQSFLFWGARAVALDQDSPLRDLRMRMNNGRTEQFQVGDVVSRIDDVRIENGMFKDRRGVFQLPELDEHFGPTTFRWIKTGHSHVNISQIMLDNNVIINGNGGGVKPVTP